MDVKNKRIEHCWQQRFNASIHWMCYTIQNSCIASVAHPHFKNKLQFMQPDSNLPPVWGERGMSYEQ